MKTFVCSICKEEIPIDDQQGLLTKDSNWEYFTIPVCSECYEKCEEE